MTAPLTSERPAQPDASEQAVQPAGTGPILPTWAVLASLALALVAALAFFITGSPDRAVSTAASSPAPGRSAAGVEPSTASDAAPRQDAPAKGGPREGGRVTAARTATVDVYNNAGVAGLAAAKGAEVRAMGWTVGTQDNWYGTIPKSTVYYPAALADEAKLLAKDLGIERTRPAVSPMSFERLSIILTG